MDNAELLLNCLMLACFVGAACVLIFLLLTYVPGLWLLIKEIFHNNF
jgi:hypothetical protein